MTSLRYPGCSSDDEIACKPTCCRRVIPSLAAAWRIAGVSILQRSGWAKVIILIKLT